MNMGDGKDHIPTRGEIKEARRADLRAIMEKDPAATSEWAVRFTYAGYKALSAYRRAHRLYLKGHTCLARLIADRARRITGVEIHPAAVISTVAHKIRTCNRKICFRIVQTVYFNRAAGICYIGTGFITFKIRVYNFYCTKRIYRATVIAAGMSRSSGNIVVYKVGIIDL